MNSVEDILQVQFMHDRMMAQEESGDKSSVAWSRLSRITKDIKRGFRAKFQLARVGSLGSSSSHLKKERRRFSVISYRSARDSEDVRSFLS